MPPNSAIHLSTTLCLTQRLPVWSFLGQINGQSHCWPRSRSLIFIASFFHFHSGWSRQTWCIMVRQHNVWTVVTLFSYVAWRLYVSAHTNSNKHTHTSQGRTSFLVRRNIIHSIIIWNQRQLWRSRYQVIQHCSTPLSEIWNVIIYVITDAPWRFKEPEIYLNILKKKKRFLLGKIEIWFKKKPKQISAVHMRWTRRNCQGDKGRAPVSTRASQAEKRKCLSLQIRSQYDAKRCRSTLHHN